MKKIVETIKRPWFISLIGVTALSLLIWFAGPYISVADTEPFADVLVRAIVITILFSLWGLTQLWKQLKAQKADKKIIAGMSTEVDADPASSQSQEEIAILKDRFDEAINFLKTADKRGNTNSLYELPWYIIIGPPGSGKTTALINSGLRFPLAERFGKEALQGVGGTRNCDWWITDDAVMIDTAGRYVTQDSYASVDSAAWEGFLDLLKNNRTRRPINGAIIAISLADLAVQSEAERDQHILAIKQRVQELHKHLGIRFPVYVLFTKVDLVAGFMEFFDDLSEDERKQIWGITFPYADEDANVLAEFPKQFEQLMTRLKERHLWRLEQERDLQRRTKIYGFPHQINSLGATIDKFLTNAFQATRFEEQPLLRGVYFTSGTQEGTPIDRIMGAVSRTFGLGQQVMPSFGGDGRSYFLTSFLKDVVFKEQGLAGTNLKVERRRTMLQAVTYAVAGVVTLIMVGLWAFSFTENKSYIMDVQAALEQHEGLGEVTTAEDLDFTNILQRLDTLYQAIELADTNADGVPIQMTFGLYQGKAIGAAASDAYIREMNALLMTAVAMRLEQQLAAASGDPDFRYEALKTYLMLGMPEKLDTELIQLWMKLDWQATYASNPGVESRLSTHLVRLLDSKRVKAVVLNNQLIADARAGLNHLRLAELVYGRIKRDYQASDSSPFVLATVLGTDGAKVFKSKSGKGLDLRISSLFTYKGFYESFQLESKALSAEIQKEDWVLGLDKGAFDRSELQSLESDMLKLYTSDYIQQWDGMLNDLRLMPIRDVPHAVEVMDILSGPQSPLRRLLNVVSRNTALNKLPDGMQIAGKEMSNQAIATGRLARLVKSGVKVAAAGKPELPGGPVHRHFEQLNQLVSTAGGAAPIERILAAISDLYRHFYELSDDVGGTSIRAATTSGDGAKYLRKIKMMASRYPQPVKDWLVNLGGHSRKVTVAGATSQLNKMWSENVTPQCRKAINGRYPFDKKSERDVTLTDFERLFGEGGIIENFFVKNLKPFVDISGKKWRLKSNSGASLGISNKSLELFQRAQRIREAFFSSGGSKTKIKFVMKPIDLDPGSKQVLLDIDGQILKYRHGPVRRSNMQWPAANPTYEVRIVFESASGNQVSRSIEGTWALFRMLDTMDIHELSADRKKINIIEGERKASFELQANSVINPFSQKELSNFKCTARL